MITKYRFIYIYIAYYEHWLQNIGLYIYIAYYEHWLQNIVQFFVPPPFSCSSIFSFLFTFFNFAFASSRKFRTFSKSIWKFS